MLKPREQIQRKLTLQERSLQRKLEKLEEGTIPGENVPE